MHQQTSKPPACSSLQHQASGHIQRPLACDPRVQPVPDNPAASCCSQGEGGQALSCGPSSMAAACGGATRRGQRARGVGRYRDGNGTGTPHRNGRKHRRLRREWRCSGGRRWGCRWGGVQPPREGRGEWSRGLPPRACRWREGMASCSCSDNAHNGTCSRPSTTHGSRLIRAAAEGGDQRWGDS